MGHNGIYHGESDMGLRAQLQSKADGQGRLVFRNGGARRSDGGASGWADPFERIGPTAGQLPCRSSAIAGIPGYGDLGRVHPRPSRSHHYGETAIGEAGNHPGRAMGVTPGAAQDASHYELVIRRMAPSVLDGEGLSHEPRGLGRLAGSRREGPGSAGDRASERHRPEAGS